MRSRMVHHPRIPDAQAAAPSWRTTPSRPRGKSQFSRTFTFAWLVSVENQRYCYRVQAVTGSGEGPKSGMPFRERGRKTAWGSSQGAKKRHRPFRKCPKSGIPSRARTV